MTDYGIDVSSFNSIASWSAVRAVPNTWTWCKATQGSGYTNPRFASQFTGAAAAGLAAGAYHFADPNVPVQANVDHFVSIAAPLGAFRAGAWLPMLDIENDTADGITWSGPVANAFIMSFRDRLRAATGVRQLCVYASQGWFSTGFLRPNDWADQDVFLCAARYGVSPGNVGWSHPRLAVHQYTDGTAQFGGTLYATDRSVILSPFTRDQLTIGGVSPAIATPGDVMFEFVANGDTVQDKSQPVSRTNGLNQVVLLLGGGKTLPATWGDVCAKDKTYGGDGTGSVLGVSGAAYQSYLDTDTATRAAEKAIAALTPAAIAQAVTSALPPSAGGTAAPTYDIATEPGGVVIAKAIPEKV